MSTETENKSVEQQATQVAQDPNFIPPTDLSWLEGYKGIEHSPEELQRIREYSVPTGQPSNEPAKEQQGSQEGGTEAPVVAVETPKVEPKVESIEVQTPSVFAKLMEDSTGEGAEKPADVKAVYEGFKTKYGIDLSDVDGALGLQQKYEELLEKAGTSEKANQELDKYKNYLVSLPDPIKAAIIAIEKGEDFNTAFEMATGKVVDFSKSFDAHNDTFGLVKKMLPNLKLTQTDFEDDPNDPQVLDAIELAKEKYVLKQREVEFQKNQSKLKQDNEINAVKQSIEKSFEKAASVFKNPNDPELKRLKTILQEGKFDELFFDQNGFREDAIEKLAYAEYAPKMISEQQKLITGLRSQVQALSNQIAVTNGKSPEQPVGAGKGLVSPVEQEIKTPEAQNKTIDEYTQYLDKKSKVKY